MAGLSCYGLYASPITRFTIDDITGSTAAAYISVVEVKLCTTARDSQPTKESFS